MELGALLGVFLAVRFGQHLVERFLAYLNKKTYENENNYKYAGRVLNIAIDDLKKTLSYSRDKYQFASIQSWISIGITLGFIALGGLGWVEQAAIGLAESFGFSEAGGSGAIVTGLLFLGLISLLSGIVSLPFDLYFTFVLEEKHGFNRQTIKGFISDRIKGIIIGSILGGLILSLILWIMQSFATWWLIAWIAVFGFSLLTVWLYPTVLAPIFNKFEPLQEGPLKDQIYSLAKKVSFQADGISIMDASTRSSHGNAYFTGVFGKKKIVLFDTLVKAMNVEEIVAILAHELGHFKLNHIRWSLVRSFFMTGVMFYLMSLCLPINELYTAFDMQAGTFYGALVVFSLWFSPISFLLQPITNLISRRNEFAADAFALKNVENGRRLGDALLKLRENSHVMPISHPAFSAVYHSHPPLLERLKAMGYIDKS